MRCEHCPLDPSLACRGENVRHFCRLVNPDDPIYTPDFARILEHDDVTEDHRPSVAQSLAKINAMKTCLFWSKCATGCSAGQCGLKNGQRVAYQTCFSCLDTYP